LRSGEADIVIGTSSVKKIFRDDDDRTARHAAEREFTLLRVLSDALADHPLISAPSPVTIGHGDRVSWLVMERKPGIPLSRWLAAGPLPEQVVHVAPTLAQGLEAYLQAIKEPYWDFCFQNVLFSPSTGAVTFHDLGVPSGSEDVARAGGEDAKAISLGVLVGWSVYQAARPSVMLRRAGRRSILHLAGEVCRRAYPEGTPPAVTAVARVRFGRLTAAGSTRRTVWYRLAWFVAGRAWLRIASGMPSASANGTGS
jgi:hypothetical protein